MANALQTVFTDIATAIRGKTGKTDPIAPANMATEIEGITGGGTSGGGFVFSNASSEFAQGITAMIASSTFEVKPYVYVPEKAENIQIYVKFRYKDASGSATSNYFEYSGNGNDLTIENEPDSHRKKILLGTFSGSVSGASYIMVDGSGNSTWYISYEIPGTYMKDYVLYAGTDVTNLFDRKMICYQENSLRMMRGIDLRGSAITTIPATYWLYDHDLLEVIYLPECLADIKNSYAIGDCPKLKELHFTSEIPPTISASSAISIPDTCTVYVPAGTLDAYKAAANYPSPSTYTYVEE